MSTLDLLTLEEARAAIMVPLNQSYDDDLAVMNTAVSTRIDELCGPVVNRSVTEYHDGGWYTVPVYTYPVSSFTSVTEYLNGSPTVLTAESAGTAGTYLYDDVARVVYRRQGFVDFPFRWGRRNIKLVYVAGRAATTETVPEKFKEAAKITLAHIWRQENGSGTQTFGNDGGDSIYRASFAIPNRAIEVLGYDIRMPGIG